MSEIIDINVIEKKNFTKDLIEKNQAALNFLKSSLAQRMANDIVQHQYYLSLEKFLYSSDKLKSDLHWNDISNENIQLFFDSIIKPDTKEKNTYDSLCPFENYTVYKLGLKIVVMIGQSSSIVISPSDMVEK